MLTKILFTAAVIAVVYLLARGRADRVRAIARDPEQRPQDRPRAAPDRTTRWLAYGVLGIMLAGSAGFLFLEWRDSYRVVTVRVINTNSGRSVSFQARRRDVQDRSFETLDGRRIVLAAVERLELGDER
jgi:hypothetical protein